MHSRLTQGFTDWWRRRSSNFKIAFVGGVVAIAAALIQGIPAWIPIWNASPTTTPALLINAPDVSGSEHAIDRIRDTLLLAPDLATAETILNDFWREGHSGFHADHHYDPAGCPNQGYGVTWNVHYTHRFLQNQVLVFSTPQDFLMFPNEGGWYVQVCLHPDSPLRAEDVGKLQAAFLQKKHDGQWSYELAK